MPYGRNFWRVALLTSFAIHAGFSLQAFLAAPTGGMASNSFFLLLFTPHYTLILFFPPAYPIDWNGEVVSVDWLRFVGKLIVAYPASLLYGCAISAFWYFVRRRGEAG